MKLSETIRSRRGALGLTQLLVDPGRDRRRGEQVGERPVPARHGAAARPGPPAGVRPNTLLGIFRRAHPQRGGILKLLCDSGRQKVL